MFSLIQTSLTSAFFAARVQRGDAGGAAALKASLAMHALGRIGRPEDVASGIVWLLDPANAWVTGQVLGIDGGLGSLRPR
ncbi:MAG: SDR family oxidoreductase [Bryobacteraceae bacterium]|nr:SDR family oxidoreductase [Bryobacteraceae bacterium]